MVKTREGQIMDIQREINRLRQERNSIATIKCHIENNLRDIRKHMSLWSDKQKYYEHNPYLNKVVKENAFEGHTVEYARDLVGKKYAEMNEYFAKTKALEQGAVEQIAMIDNRISYIDGQIMLKNNSISRLGEMEEHEQ